MASADTPSSIANWPPEGLSWDDALERGPAWNDYVTARAKAPRIPLAREVAGGAASAEEMRLFGLYSTARNECNAWLREQLQSGVLVLKCRQPEKLQDDPMTVPPAMTRYLRLDPHGVVHGPNLVLCDPRIFSAASLNPTPKPPVLVKVEGPVETIMTPARRKGSRDQEMIRRMCAEEWSGGCEDVETRVIIKQIGRRLQDLGKTVPKRDVFLRALGRRK
jgi:hypothetical protein